MAPGKRRPGGGRKPTLNKVSTFSTRITARTRGALEAEAARRGISISQLAEKLLDEGLKDGRHRNVGSPVRALAFVIDGVALISKSNAEDGRICEWNNDPTVFETFRIAVDKLLERLRPPGDIDTSIEGPLIGRSPEHQAEAIVRQIWTGLQSAEPLSPTQINAIAEQRGWRAMPEEVVAAMSVGSYSAADARRDLNIKPSKDERD